MLIIVLVTMLFATFALIAFMDRATNDLLVTHRDAIARRLRMEAYSALEVTLAVLNNFQQVDNGLHSPAEGWTDPLGFAGYTPTEDRRVEVSFEDESGKISLPRADAPTLSRLFQAWGVQPTDADSLADAMMGWMQRNHVYSTPINPDYDESAIPYEPPGRPMRSYAELAAIDKVRDFFYDKNGEPNDYWRRFVADVSLFNFAQPNINGALPDTLAAVGQFDPNQQQMISDYLSGAGQYQSNGPQYFQDPRQAATVTGQGGNTTGFGTTISALRINITVYEGRTMFRLSAVVAPPNGATTVQETATSQKTQTSASSAQTAAQKQSGPNATQGTAGASGTNASTAATQNLRYPFTLLEIQENDEIPPAPPPVATPSS
ncbi:MAG TPA: hypothetical protein VHE61_12680 [Opitutaceae bacterium]|nr:hypothetical protein [Opitutaceae bacterium]